VLVCFINLSLDFRDEHDSVIVLDMYDHNIYPIANCGKYIEVFRLNINEYSGPIAASIIPILMVIHAGPSNDFLYRNFISWFASDSQRA
jgi:hypothetical protein